FSQHSLMLCWLTMLGYAGSSNSGQNCGTWKRLGRTNRKRAVPLAAVLGGIGFDCCLPHTTSNGHKEQGCHQTGRCEYFRWRYSGGQLEARSTALTSAPAAGFRRRALLAFWTRTSLRSH